jgi:hypothetical protein
MLLCCMSSKTKDLWAVLHVSREHLGIVPRHKPGYACVLAFQYSNHVCATYDLLKAVFGLPMTIA